MQPSIRCIALFLLQKSNYSHSFFQIYCVFPEQELCSKEILTMIIIPPWFQAWIYWNKFVIWRHHFQPSNFSMIVSLFHVSTWSNPHVNETVFISQHFLQPSIIMSGLWLIWENVEEYVEENHCSPALLKVPTYSSELVAIIFVWKTTMLNAQKHLQRPYSFMVNQHSYIFSKIKKNSAESKG